MAVATIRGVVRLSTGEIDTDVARAEDPADADLCLLVSAAGTLSSYPLTSAHPIVIGRARSCDLVIDHPSVSRRHAELTVAPLGIRDLGSSNGTRLRGKRILASPPTRLEIGDAVQLGDAVVLVQRSPTSRGRPWRGELLDGRLADECARSARSGQPFAFARLHVDVDADLDIVDHELASTLRATDQFTSAGPAQFQLLLIDTPPASARQVIARVIARLEARGLSPRWSVATWPRDGTTAEQLAAHAWNALRVAGGAMDRIRAVIEQIADSSLSVLIRGETGVGKELCAEMIHRLSRRARKPFVRINCAALTEQLLESELFGHERGAFTGAAAAKPGLIETADGGTLFLDEVGDLPRTLQAKLLRVLEDRVVQRVGAVAGRTVDVRFVAATNRVLEADMAGGRFRRDLYFRLGGVTIEIPPLRERLDELDGLVAAFVARAAAAARQPAPAVTAAALAALREHAWPGNVRELRNTIERAVLLCGAGPLDVEHLTLADIDLDADAIATSPAAERSTDRFSRPTVPAPGSDEGLRGEVAQLEAARIQDALHACGGNQTRAARLLGIARNTLQARMDAFGIPRPRKPPPRPG